MVDLSAADLRIEARFKNARLFNAVIERFTDDAIAMRALTPKKTWSRPPIFTVAATEIGIRREHLYRLVNLSRSPVNKKSRQWTKSARAIAEFFGVPLQELFPLHLYEDDLPKVIVKELESEGLRVSMEEAKKIAGVSIDPVEAMALSSATNDALSILSPRLQKIIEMRFGLNGEQPQTLAEIGERLGVSANRIRQLEAKAVRQLRHPVVSWRLRGFL